MIKKWRFALYCTFVFLLVGESAFAQVGSIPKDRLSISKDKLKAKTINASKLSILPQNIPYKQGAGGRVYDANIVPQQYFRVGEQVELSARETYSSRMAVRADKAHFNAQAKTIEISKNGFIRFELPKSGHVYRAELSMFPQEKGGNAYVNMLLGIEAGGTVVFQQAPRKNGAPLRLLFEVPDNELDLNRITVRIESTASSEATLVLQKATITRLEAIAKK